MLIARPEAEAERTVLMEQLRRYGLTVEEVLPNGL